jgi:D-apionolactonase
MVLYAGPLQMLYERGFLRYISYQDSEILRMMYFALRDEEWNTCEHVITREEKDISWETFRITYHSVHRKNGNDLIRWKVEITGIPDSSITFTIDGEVIQKLKKNRAGFCILHPLKGVKGQPVEITHPDGSMKSDRFPENVEPRNPFKDIKKLKWVFDNKHYELEFEGEIFETEDQRNWIDTSFKTFCTPADLPIPVTLEAGDKIFQRVKFRPLQKTLPITSHESPIIQLEKTRETTHLPEIGFLLSSIAGFSDQTRDRLASLHANHFAIEVTPSQPDWVATFSKQCETVYALNAGIKVILKLAEDFKSQLEQFVQLVLQNRLKVTEVILVTESKPVTSQKLIDEVDGLKSQLPGVKWGGGTLGDFKDLNRNRFDSRSLDFISYSAHPQVHAFDDRTLIENIDGLRETGSSASVIYPKQAIHLCPVTLQKRSVTKPDPRQKTECAALWAFGALRAAAEGKALSITLFEATGPMGIISDDGRPYPVFSILEKVVRFRNHQMVVLNNAEPLLVDAMLFTSDSSTTLLLINYTDDLQTVRYGRNEFQVPPMQLHEVNLSGT